jgi:hypothetical protein
VVLESALLSLPDVVVEARPFRWLVTAAARERHNAARIVDEAAWLDGVGGETAEAWDRVLSAGRRPRHDNKPSSAKASRRDRQPPPSVAAAAAASSPSWPSRAAAQRTALAMLEDGLRTHAFDSHRAWAHTEHLALRWAGLRAVAQLASHGLRARLLSARAAAEAVAAEACVCVCALQHVAAVLAGSQARAPLDPLLPHHAAATLPRLQQLMHDSVAAARAAVAAHAAFCAWAAHVCDPDADQAVALPAPALPAPRPEAAALALSLLASCEAGPGAPLALLDGALTAEVDAALAVLPRPGPAPPAGTPSPPLLLLHGAQDLVVPPAHSCILWRRVAHTRAHNAAALAPVTDAVRRAARALDAALRREHDAAVVVADQAPAPRSPGLSRALASLLRGPPPVMPLWSPPQAWTWTGGWARRAGGPGSETAVRFVTDTHGEVIFRAAAPDCGGGGDGEDSPVASALLGEAEAEAEVEVQDADSARAPVAEVLNTWVRELAHPQSCAVQLVGRAWHDDLVIGQTTKMAVASFIATHARKADYTVQSK